MRERGRTRRLFGLGARTGGALLKTRLGGQTDWRALGEALFDGLSELKGPAMKLAQIMSQWDDLLPPDLANELEKKILEKLGVGPTVDAEAPADPIGVDDF